MSSPPRARVVVSAELPGPAIAALRAEHEVFVGEDPRGLGHAGLLRHAAGAAALLTLVSDRVEEAVLDRAGPSLRVVAQCAVGVDNIDLVACRARGVVVTNTPDVLTDATADLTFALLLDACRRVTEGDRLVRAGGFNGFSPTLLLGVRVTGATLGIIGLGRIGRAVAKRAKGFSMRVVYAQRTRASVEVEAELGASFVPLELLLRESDIVSLSCPLSEETRGLLSRERLASMKRGAVLINAARGACVDEAALADVLASGHLAAAGLDVYAHEPVVHAGLLASESAVLAPHIGSADRPTREAMASLAAEAVLDVLAGRPPRFRLS